MNNNPIHIEVHCHPNLKLDGRTITRQAVRAIIPDGRRLLMVHARVSGEYKFPGGGVNNGETHTAALAREIREEVGAVMRGTPRLFGQAVEYIRPDEADFDLFKMTSTYYLCEVEDGLGAQKLDDYETELGFWPVWVNVADALRVNRALLEAGGDLLQRWTAREAAVLAEVEKELR